MRRDYYKKIKVFMSSPASLIISFIWGFAEASLFFLIPDIYLGAAALFSPIYGLWNCVFSIIGAMLGGSIMYLMAHKTPQAMLGLMAKIPGISEAMVMRVGDNYQAHGLSAIFLAPWDGIPYKIYAVQAGVLGINYPSFLIATVPARLERFLVVVLIAALLGATLKGNISKNTGRWIMAYMLFWAIGYTFYIISLAGGK